MTTGFEAARGAGNASHHEGDGFEAALTERFRQQVARRLAEHARADEEGGRPPQPPEARRELGRRLIAELFDDYAAEVLSAGRAPLDHAAEQRVARRVFDGLFGLAGFQPYLDDPRVENVNANGCDVVHVRYADGGREQVAPVARSDGELVELVRTVAARAGVEERRFDRASPGLSVQLPDGSRLFAVMAVTPRPSVSIRRHPYVQVSLDDLAAKGTIDAGLRQFLGAAVRAGKNIVVCGGTGVGKTTLLRGLAAEIGPWERLVTIEDSYELALDRDPAAHPDVVALQAREANVEGEGGIGLAELVRWALRMSPDRVIVGEARGSEVVPMLNAMSQGNDGSMTTLHASTSKGAFTKLAAYAAQAAERLPMEATALLVASAVHFVVHLAFAPDGTRVVSSIREVVDADGVQVASNEVWRPGPGRRAVPGVPLRAGTVDELVAAGFDPGWWDRPDGWWQA